MIRTIRLSITILKLTMIFYDFFIKKDKSKIKSKNKKLRLIQIFLPFYLLVILVSKPNKKSNYTYCDYNLQSTVQLLIG